MSDTPETPENAAAEKKPRIALIGSPFVHKNENVMQSKQRMHDALIRHGADPVDIDVAHPPASYAEFDGIVMTGNDWDIDPKDYTPEGQPVTTHEKTKSELKRENYASEADYALGLARREQEIAAITTAFEKKIPLFGVCGGMQRINVVKGGTLKQHVEGGNQAAPPELHGEGGNQAAPPKEIPPHTPTRTVYVLPESKLAHIANGHKSAIVPTFTDETGSLTQNQADENINSFHHQVIDKVGEGLISNTIAPLIGKPNEVTTMGIESREPRKHFVLGVQWHPEFMPQSQLNQNILEGVVQAAKGHAKTKGNNAAVGAQTEAMLAATPGGGIVKT